ncbi:hypothetical protein [Nocardia asteroides]|uniref:hypothetical protein n=1 Tax=Nocardia asteroides TaxID=1824 RepID=UPI001E2D6400|nr:hypothetical protein [Nocardia asteroides]UGT55191.1 hypothetical protein LTT85_32210 [Nocardia asteroides]
MAYPEPRRRAVPGRADRLDGEFPDHARTTRTHAGEGLEDGYNFPGIILCALGVIALGLCLTATGYGFGGWAFIGAVAAVVLAGAGVTWLLVEHRRIKTKEGLALTDPRGH